MKKKTGFKIVKDLINDDMIRNGVKSENWDELDHSKKVQFRCKDDDGETYYVGYLIDNDYADGQIEALDFCRADAGCVLIEVKINGVWTVEIDG